MVSRFRIWAAVAVAALLTGCAVPKMDVSAARMSTVKTIEVVRPPESSEYIVMNFGHPGLAFGLIGGLVAAADQASKSKRLTEAYKTQGTTAFTTVLAERVVARLSASGYNAKVVDSTWQETNGVRTLPYEKITSSADAVLIIVPTIVGFTTKSMVSDYVPTITVVATLVDKDRKEIYKGFHATGWLPPQEGWKGSPAKATYANFDKLMEEAKSSAAALEEAASAIAESVKADLAAAK